jgi:hypothetical protein
MGVIPEKTTPLTKFIRTGEGVLVFAFNLTMLIVPIVSNSLSPGDAVKWAGIVNGVAVISRTGLKVVAEFSKSTGIEPQPIGNLSTADATADSAGNGGAPEVVIAPTQPVVVTGPSDDEEFASTPTADDDAVMTPSAPVPSASGATTDDDAVEAPTPASPTPADPDVSDAEEFASVPPPDVDDTTDVGPQNGDQAGSLASVGTGASGAPNPIVVNGGDQES